MLRSFTFLGVLSLALTGIASAQTAPARPPGPPNGAAFAARGASFAIRGAYREISEAETHGSSPYLDAAKAHYRSAVSHAASNDRSAAGEAMAASALARAAIADRPLPAPRDIPAPPAPQAPPARGSAVASARPPMHGPMMMHGRFDAARIAADAKRAGTPEARDLAQKAVDANVAGTHAGFSGNEREAMRQNRVADALAMAVHSLADAAHPPPMPQMRGRG